MGYGNEFFPLDLFFGENNSNICPDYYKLAFSGGCFLKFRLNVDSKSDHRFARLQLDYGFAYAYSTAEKDDMHCTSYSFMQLIKAKISKSM